MSLSIMQQLMETHLNTLDPKPRISWANVAFTPTAEEVYFEPKFYQTSKKDNSVDRTGSMLVKATMAVMVYVPKTTGTFVLRNWLDALEAHFSRGLILENGTVAVRVRETNRTQTFTLDTRYAQCLDISCCTIHK